MQRSFHDVFTRGFLPTWIALTGIVAVQMIALFTLPEHPRARVMEWSPAARAVVSLAVAALTAAWALPRLRATSLLIGAMSITLVTMRHSIVTFHGPVPPQHELFVFYTAAAVLLAAGAVDRARAVEATPS